MIVLPSAAVPRLRRVKQRSARTSRSPEGPGSATSSRSPRGSVAGRWSDPPAFNVYTVAPDGSLLVSDDGSNSIWRVSYTGK